MALFIKLDKKGSIETNVPKYVVKRDGRLEEFNQTKITNAIFKAAKAVGGKDWQRAKYLSDQVVRIIAEKFEKGEFKDKYPHVEEIQDIVEKVLVENGHYKTAKAYILYREQHRKIREAKNLAIDIHNTVAEYLFKEDWRVKENSNSAYSFSGLMAHIANKVIAYYVLNEIYPREVREAHLKGYFHIHDLGYGIVGYCSGWSLRDLLIMGFGGVPNKTDAKPAKHLSALVGQMNNFLGCAQMEFAGAQSFSSVDTYLAPFVREDKLDYKEVKQNLQRLIYNLNIPSRWAAQAPFTNFTFDLTVPEDMKEMHVIVGGKMLDYTYEEVQEEMDMINKAFLELMLEGDAKGRIFTFPIPTYNLTKDFDWDSEIAELLFEVTGKYGIPYFQNYIGSDLDPRSIRAMCCRLNLNLKELEKRGNGLFGAGEKTGSIGVVTINMNRLGYEAKGDEDKFFELLEYYMEVAKVSLEIKREVITKNLRRGLMPYSKVYLGEKEFTTYFSTIGLVGMNEALLNLFGIDIASEEGKRFTIKTLKFMRSKLIEFQEETGNLYNLEATPAESASYRLAMLDKKMYPDIITAGTKERPYLTNSTQLPVDYTDDLIFAIEHQNDIQPLYTGGTVFHTYLGESISGEEAKELVKMLAKTKMPYFSITPTFSICKEHGYFSGEHLRCPVCGRETEVFSRVVGYFRPTKNWNSGKKQEWNDRVMFKLPF